MKKQISELLKTSKKVIKDCSLPNGAIVAVNSTKSYVPKEAKYYKFVWPRDAMYICSVANILGLNIQEKFFKWCLKAEGWEKTGLFYQNYFINGKKVAHNFQPDQTGSVLMAVYNHYKNNKNDCQKFEKLIKRSANGLCKIWSKDHFNLVTQDLWEDRRCFPDLKGNFTYSLAICSKGLSCANELIPNKKWLKNSDEMKSVLLKNFDDHFYRSFGKINDNKVDASLLGLVWPSKMLKADDKRMKKTIELIEEKIVEDGGVCRYKGDRYGGWMYNGNTHRKKGAGYWPLLNFWMTIYYLELGNKKKALKYYNKVLNDLGNKKYIPEQIFNNKIQVAVSPLCWSHAMFVIASKKLGYI
ncbi:MAG: hypothetical protein KAU07_00545 [Candidatus Andersenbacteria bacterium]|nr:hypothetical protein [Candidatus Andersenbacteria bacterium]